MRTTVIAITSAAVALAALGTMSAAEASSKYSVTVAASTAALDLGHSVTLSGAVSPGASGKTVDIQRKYTGGSWKTIAHDTLSSHSKYSKSIKPTKAAITSYRVVKSHSSSHASGASPTVVVKVGRWRYLTDLPLHEAPVVGTVVGTATIHGKAYKHSIIAGQTNMRSYVTNGLCPRLKSYVGWEDRSAANSTGEPYAVRFVRLGPGGPGPAGRSFYDGPDPVQNQDPVFYDYTFTTDPLPLAIGVGSNTETTDYLIAWGSPKVYCYS